MKRVGCCPVLEMYVSMFLAYAERSEAEVMGQCYLGFAGLESEGVKYNGYV